MSSVKEWKDEGRRERAIRRRLSNTKFRLSRVMGGGYAITCRLSYLTETGTLTLEQAEAWVASRFPRRARA